MGSSSLVLGRRNFLTVRVVLLTLVR